MSTDNTPQKKPAATFDPAKEKDPDELVHTSHTPATPAQKGTSEEKDLDDLVHDQPIVTEDGSLPDPETLSLEEDDETENDLRRK